MESEKRSKIPWILTKLQSLAEHGVKPSLNMAYYRFNKNWRIWKLVRSKQTQRITIWKTGRFFQIHKKETFVKVNNKNVKSKNNNLGKLNNENWKWSHRWFHKIIALWKNESVFQKLIALFSTAHGIHHFIDSRYYF